jgi:hypothetical protein
VFRYPRSRKDEGSRLARNLEAALKVVRTLDFHGVRVIALTQGIDSRDKTSRQLLTLHGMMDEQYLAGLADKVHRGQEGRVLKGLQPGGGASAVPMCPSRSGSAGQVRRPAVCGAVVRRKPSRLTKALWNLGEPGGARTRDHRIKSAMLYQLSYRPGAASR